MAAAMMSPELEAAFGVVDVVNEGPESSAGEPRRRLDQDHFGAEVREDPPGYARAAVRQVEHAKMGEHPDSDDRGCEFAVGAVSMLRESAKIGWPAPSRRRA